MSDQTLAHAIAPSDDAPGLDSARVRLGASTRTPGHVLSELAQDAAVTVRAAVALNPACPPHVDQALTRDPDERVRALLVRKLALLLPTLSGAEQAIACEHVRATLAALAADTAMRVRLAIAECVKAMPDAPHSLILQLANDTALPVCDPVIRLSPLLTDADLLAVLTVLPHPSAATSVASRFGLSARVADAVAAGTDSAAVRALLSNHSAAIQETTLDALIDQARPHPGWHAPLARRPVLTAQAARTLSGFVASGLLDAMVQRSDLDAATITELRCRVAARLQQPASTEALGRGAKDSELMACLHELDQAGALNEASLLKAARDGDQRRVAAILAVCSGVSLDAVDRAGALRNAKGLLSLAWSAGFTMRTAEVAQAMLGQLGPGAVLLPGTDGGFPLSDDEMQWQLEVLGQVVR